MISTLNDFHTLSGLKINLSKCKAVWIGKDRNKDSRLCDEFNLIWSNKFKLLGIDFDVDLANMDTNFRKKIEEIKKLYSSWLYRHLTPLGRVTVIKSLGLSKLTHVALVCPHMDEKQMEELEKMSFKFLWKDKPDRIRRVVAMLATEKGGLNMVDIKAFWDSLKLSWSRRFLTSSGVWQKILQLNLLRENFEMKDIWYGGPSFVKRISHHMTNIFWRHTIQAIQKLQQKTPYNYPHFFYHLNFYDNDFFAVKKI